MTGKVKVELRPEHDSPGPPTPACVRIRGARCLCRECGGYLTVAHIVRGERKAFCADCCPVCRTRPPLSGQGGQGAA
jgi:hypothetical protein